MMATNADGQSVDAERDASGRIIRVLFIIDELCRIGGAEGALLKIVNHLPRERFQPSVVTFRIDPSVEAFHCDPCPLHVLPLRRTYDQGALETARRLRKLIRDGRINIVHTFFETADLWGGIVAKLSGCPILISSRRDMGIQRTWKHWPAYRILRGIFDEVQTVSEEVRRFSIQTDGLDPSRVRTIYTGVSPGLKAVSRTWLAESGFQMQSASHIITAVGNVRQVKGFDTLIKTAARVCHFYPRAMFVIAGEVLEPDHYNSLKLLANSLGVKRNVHFLGPINDIPGLLEASCMFCMLSRSEGLSNALLEAMAAGLPCVVTRVGGNPEVIEDGGSGYLVENENDEIAALAILELLRRPDMGIQMGRRGTQIVKERFTVDAMISNLVRSYESLLSAHLR